MRIRTKIKLIGIALVLLAGIIYSFIFWLGKFAESEHEKEDTATQTIKILFEMDTLVNEYILHPSERSANQWWDKQTDLEGRLSTEIFENIPEEQELIDKMRQEHFLLRASFEELVVINDRGSMSADTEIVRNRLMGQLSESGNRTVEEALLLTERLRVREAKVQAMLNTVGITIFIFSLLIGLFGTRILINNISSPLRELSDFAKKISQGKFAAVISPALLRRSDEFSQVGEVFEHMTRKLETLYANVEAEKEKFATLVENLPVGVGMVSAPEGAPVIVNKKVVEILGRGIIPETRKERYVQDYDILTEDGTPYPVEELPPNITLRTAKKVIKRDVIVRRPDGEKRNLYVISVPVKDSLGKLQFVISVFDDITREKEVDRAKSEFISIASHQLRTPISSLKWLVESLEISKKLDARERQYVKDLSVAVSRLVKLVEDLLNLSRMQVGKLGGDIKEINAVESIEFSVSGVEEYVLLNKHSIKSNFNIDSSLHVIIDPKVLYNILQNLITNAADYSPLNTEVIVNVNREGNLLKISVWNSSVIPEEERGNIFQKFFRGGEAKKNKPDGTGLGLYIVKSLVEGSGGKIGFTSSEKEGTTFWFTLPLKSNNNNNSERS